jgi:hypothetical protein
MNNSNHWEQLDLSRVQRFSEDDTRDSDLMVTKKVYAGIKADDIYAPRPCDCAPGETRQYRVTVGAFQCPSCRTLERFDGRVIR